LKARVLGSLSLLVGSKIVTIQVPFIFKDLVDSLSETSRVAATVVEAGAAEAAVTGAVATDAAALEPMVAVPLGLVIGYGVARSTAAGAQEVQ
ncbi:unnamed protein product, partial [Discosporangium mesarthrocarpum]